MTHQHLTQQLRCNNMSPAKSRSTKQILFMALLLSVICVLINPLADQQVEAKKLKLKDKKMIKSVVKGLIYKNLSTRKNFLPLPVPIPVRIELSEPPVYLKGKPKYVTIYKPAPPPPKPLPPIYNVNVYPGSYEHSNTYTPAYATSGHQSYLDGYSGASSNTKPTATSSSSSNDYNSLSSSMSGLNFNDFDDDLSNYYLPQKQSSAPRGIVLNGARRSGDAAEISDEVESNHWSVPDESEESIDNQDLSGAVHRRFRRQAYESSYENEPPCYGFPLEINIKSRIKMDQIFPIHGKSQIKKCIKLKRPLLPPVEDYPPPY